MGTTKPGRYMNTKGSARTMSQFSLVHASEGKFTRPQKPTDPLKLMSGDKREWIFLINMAFHIIL